MKALGDPPYRPSTQNVGAYAPDGAAEDLDMIEKLARGYIYTDKSKADICSHNAEVSVSSSLSLSDSWTLTRAWVDCRSLLMQGPMMRRKRGCCSHPCLQIS